MKQTQKVNSRLAAFRIIVGTSFIFFFLVMWLNAVFGIGYIHQEQLDKNVHVDIHRTNGVISSYDTPYFEPISMGDQIIATYHPDRDEQLSGPVLTFTLYHSRVSVFSGDRLIYAQEAPRKGGQVGGKWYSIGLPDDYREYPLVIRAEVLDYGSLSSLTGIKIVETGNEYYALMQGKSGEFLLFSSLMTVSIFMFILLMYVSIRQKHFIYDVRMAWFCICATMWILGYYKMFYLISNQEQFCANIEYFSLFMLPVPLSMYMSHRLKSPVFHRIANLFKWTMLFFFVVTTIVHYSPLEYTYCYFLRPLHILLALCSAIYGIGLIYDYRMGKSDNEILQTGLFISIGLELLELLRFALAGLLGDQFFFLRNSLSPYAILVLLITIILSLIKLYIDDLQKKMKQQQLALMAYMDPLTRCPNRAAVYRSIEEMTEKQVKDYIMFFVDLDGLKHANDVYGHEIGDALICRTAILLHSCFEEDGFFGRWGGDEFVACVYENVQEPEVYLKRLEERMREENKHCPENEQLSLSVGYVVSTAAKPIDYLNAINGADDNMYIEKKKHHFTR